VGGCQGIAIQLLGHSRWLSGYWYMFHFYVTTFTLYFTFKSSSCKKKNQLAI